MTANDKRLLELYGKYQTAAAALCAFDEVADPVEYKRLEDRFTGVSHAVAATPANTLVGLSVKAKICNEDRVTHDRDVISLIDDVMRIAGSRS